MSAKAIAWNSITGLYWDGTAFVAHTADNAAVLDAAELAVLRATYLNVDCALFGGD